MTSAVLDGIFPRSRTTDPVTSVDAGRAANLTGSQQQAIRFLLEHPGREWTLAQFAVAILLWAQNQPNTTVYSIQRYQSVVSELRRQGLVEDTGRLRPEHGRSHGIWKLAERTRRDN